MKCPNTIDVDYASVHPDRASVFYTQPFFESMNIVGLGEAGEATGRMPLLYNNNF